MTEQVNFVEAMAAAGLQPIFIDDADDLGEQLDKLLRQRETNVEFMTRLMEYCPQGAIGQAFIIEALTHYCAAVKEAPAEECESGLLAPGLWKNVGVWMQSELDKRFAKGGL